MKLEQSFDVAAPIDPVWEALIDVEHVAPCLPGAASPAATKTAATSARSRSRSDRRPRPTRASSRWRTIDEDSHSATMQAQGTDKRGQGGAKATITSSLAESRTGTHVEVITDYHITGRLARFGRGGMIEDISERLLREFAQCLQ